LTAHPTIKKWVDTIKTDLSILFSVDTEIRHLAGVERFSRQTCYSRRFFGRNNAGREIPRTPLYLNIRMTVCSNEK
jgi:hypothetical protein